jgi:hypothetical protein
MFSDVTCAQCGEKVVLSVQPPERRRPLSRNERPHGLPTTIDEFLCPNGHYRELTHTESRMLE